MLSQSLDRKKFEFEIVFTSGGSWFELPEDRGKRHLMEHCIASRTKTLNFQQLKDFEYSENLMLNAYTQPITMGLTVGGHYSDFKKMIDLLLEMAFEPSFDQDILNREREIVLREISERRGDPNYRLHFETMGKVFTPDSYSNHQVLGDIEMVTQTSIEDFYRMHKQNLKKSHVLFLLSGGGIDMDYFESKLNGYLDQSELVNEIESKPKVNFQVDNHFQDFQFLPVVSKLAHSHAELSIFIPCHVNYQNKPALQVFESLFLKYGGIVYDKLRDELGLVYGIHNAFDINLQVLDIFLSCEIQYIDEILHQIKEVFSDFSSVFNEQKFNQYKQIIRKKLDISQDTLGASIAFTQNMLRTYGVAEEYNVYADRLIAVTKDEVEEVYNYVQSSLDKMKVVVVSNDPKINKIQL